MSKRQYKSHASTSRTVSGAGFGGFATASTSNTLSYLVEPPDLTNISDANILIGFKNLSKKDSTTKIKALEDLRSFFQSHPYDEDGGTEESVLEAWVRFYPRISIDNSRRVRELAHTVFFELLKSVRKRIERFLPSIVGSWLAGTFDRDRAVARAAKEGISFLLDSDEKVLMFWTRCQPQILDYAQEAINETQQTLSNERTMSIDDASAKYYRVISASISLVTTLLVQLSEEKRGQFQDKYKAFVSDNKQLWTFCIAEDATVRKATAKLLLACLEKQDDLVKIHLPAISHAFISEGLRSSQSTSALYLLSALAELTTRFPQVWTTEYKGKKSPRSLLEAFIEKGSQGGPPDYWKVLHRLFTKLPIEVLPSESDACLQFLTSYLSGVSHRTEPRQNAIEAWSIYFEVVKMLTSNAPVSIMKQSIHPVFEQYLHPTTENIRWSVANTTTLAKAYAICANAPKPAPQDLEKEWSRLSSDLVSKMSLSLPAQSKEYNKSQVSVANEGTRWFALLSDISLLKLLSPSLLAQSRAITTCAMKTLRSRNGKLFSAASILESALQVAPVHHDLFDEIVKDIRTFLQQEMPKLIMSPSSQYLISSLKFLRPLPGQERVAEGIWEATIAGVLPLTNSIEKMEVVTALISDQSIAVIAHVNLALQEYLLNSMLHAIESNTDPWSLFEAAMAYKIPTVSTELKLLENIVACLDPEKTTMDGAFRALDIISKTRPDLLKSTDRIHFALLTKSLALAEMTNSSISARANDARTAIEVSHTKDCEGGGNEAAIIHVIQENLKSAHPRSLSVNTLIKQARKLLELPNSKVLRAQILPDTVLWYQDLGPLLSQPPDTCLGVLRPFAGAIYLTQASSIELENHESSMRDCNGYSVALRMAMYAAEIIADHPESLPTKELLENLYLIGITAYIANDQLDLNEDYKLFSSRSGSEAIENVRTFVYITAPASSKDIIVGADSWLKSTDNMSISEPNNNSTIARQLVHKLVDSSKGATPTAFYSARFLGQLLSRLVEAHGWSSIGDDVLSELDILNSSTLNHFGAVAALTGIQNGLQTSKSVIKLCNSLISDIADATLQFEKTLRLLILLNSTLEVYDKDHLPVAQNRLVFAVKQILSWTTPFPSDYVEICAEACRALYTLLPATKDVYGPHWASAIDFCIATCTFDDKDLSLRIPSIGMALKLIWELKIIHDANDDLEEGLELRSEHISRGLIHLLGLPRHQTTQPLEYVDTLLSRLVQGIPLAHLKDLSEFYPLLSSDFPQIQSIAFDVLHRTIPAAQQQLSIDVLLDKKEAHLPEELLSLLLEAPSVDAFSDEALNDFPSSIRGYLLSWHLIYDSFNNASYKVRGDYSDNLKSNNYIGPLLTFMFDVLGHSAGNPLNLDKAHFGAHDILSYNPTEAANMANNERHMQWLLIHVYYLCLKNTPSLAKTWWMDCKSKQTRTMVESWTEKYFSPLVVEDTIGEVQKWADEQQSTEEDKELLVKASRRSREVFAAYAVDDMQMQIVIRLPAAYPLEGVKVEGINRVAVSEKKWTSWLMVTQGVITVSNGSISDGLTAFRKNVVGALKGQTECAICYSIVSSDRRIPDKRCQTCKNLFHSNCLFKWFASSNQSTCPLCRNPFNYGSESGRRGLA